MKYDRYTREQKELVRKLSEEGLSKSAIARAANIPRSTLRNWISPRYVKVDASCTKCDVIYNPIDYLDTPLKKQAYSFILGVYLCDGHISRLKYRAPCMRLFNDLKYPKNTNEWASKLKILFPDNSVNTHKRNYSNCSVVLVYSNKLISLFPQHGAGKKHDRKIQLLPWQQNILAEFPSEFIRACIQSDGCIYLSQGKYKYYAFTNKSEDIMNIFLKTLQLVGIEKNKYWAAKKKVFVAQNFKAAYRAILENIIHIKE